MAEPPWNKADRAGFILVVDSDPRNLVFMSMILQRLEYRACSAPGTGHALEIAHASVPLLIVAELNLRGLTGLDLMRHLKDDPRTENVPVVIMTREWTPDLEQRCRDAGAAGCLEKPVQAHELYRTIHPIAAPGSRRKNARIRTTLPVAVDDRFLDCADGECATNLSTNGMLIRTIGSYPVDSVVLVRAVLHGQEIFAEARVVYCRRADDGSEMWCSGLQFQKTSPQGKEIIRRFINDEVSHGLAP